MSNASDPQQLVLASDLDGTLIPLPDNDANRQDLHTLAAAIKQHQISMVFITGRHFASAIDALKQHGLPQPGWVISDVGTSIFAHQADGAFALVEAYQQHLQEIVAALPIQQLKQHLASIEALREQEAEKQGRFKLSYYADADNLKEIVAEVQQKLDQLQAPWSLIESVDPFNGDGLVDLLPKDVSKAHALAWWVKDQGLDDRDVVFAGDSGNDLAALTAGYRAIVVGNASREIARQAYESHQAAGWSNRLYLAPPTQQATTAVLQGCRWFNLIDQADNPKPSIGATPVTSTATQFNVWAPSRSRVEVEVVTDGAPSRHSLAAAEDGYFRGVVEGVVAGAKYRYVLDEEVARPDPASHFQPEGVHGPSQVVDHGAFAWTDQAWRGVAKRDLIVYEMHVGAFTQEGTYRAAIERLPHLVDLGVTAIELLPLAQTPGGWNWGYDGVDFFAPRNTFGTPDDLKALVDACHAAGLAVLLDVVYNHSGPEGNYLADFGPYFSTKHHSPWGDTFNFDDEGCQAVRNFVTANAVYWLDAYHMDGLRLDAVHFMHDDSQPAIYQEVSRAVDEFRQRAGREIHLIGETNVYDHEFLQQHGEAPPYDAIWCDDLMHAIYSNALPDLQLTYRKYLGAGDVTMALQRGFLFDIQEDPLEPVRSTQPAPASGGHEHTDCFVLGLQTHDSVGNHPLGKRLHHLTSPEYQMAAAPLAYLYPGIPMLFMGEEVATEAPFPFFVDFEDPALQRAVEVGRAKEYPQYKWGSMMSPTGPEPFEMAKCYDPAGHDDRVFQWYRNLFALRKQGLERGWLAARNMHVQYHAEYGVFELRFESAEGHVRILSRLAQDSHEETVAMNTRGELLLCSLSGAKVENGQVTLQQHHAVIVREG